MSFYSSRIVVYFLSLALLFIPVGVSAYYNSFVPNSPSGGGGFGPSSYGSNWGNNYRDAGYNTNSYNNHGIYFPYSYYNNSASSYYGSGGRYYGGNRNFCCGYNNTSYYSGGWYY